ncbi:MAG: outer membrane beta-barrel domain-containing protein [Burkholderiaceae bacterium]
MRRHLFKSGSLLGAVACVLLSLGWTCAIAQTPAGSATQPANEQVIVPQVERRGLNLPRFPSNDFEVGLFAGTYSMQDFGSNAVTGVRLGYHITEDFFFESAYGRTKVSDTSFRQIQPAGIFPTETVNLTYYNFSMGYNLLAGEAFFGKNTAKATAIYLIGGVGSTKFNQLRRQTINFGWGVRLMLADWAAAQVDLRDHVFSHDLLGTLRSTHNLEMSAGLAFYF